MQFVTAHARCGEGLDLDWTSFADRDSTLAVYMEREAAKATSAIASDMPTLLLIGNALASTRSSPRHSIDYDMSASTVRHGNEVG